jgi:hypothetical protein
VTKRITITVSEEVARWARREAARKSMSVSKLVRDMLEEQMRIHDAGYWKAYETFKQIQPVPGFDASKRLTREEVNERRR